MYIRDRGYIYGYVQDLESGMWQYIILDFETGETIFTMDAVSYTHLDVYKRQVQGR